MAKVVAGLGVAHRPSLPKSVADAPGQLAEEGLFASVREQLEAAQPDVIIEITADHFTNFYHHNMPLFCVGVFEESSGPERHQTMPRYTVPSDTRLSTDLLEYSRETTFDLAFTQEVILDHTILVPLHFLTPTMQIPVVPFYVNAMAAPIATTSRAFALGGMLRQFIESWDSDKRVALLASGSFALEVGGPKVGWTDMEWMETVQSHLLDARYEELARLATAERMMAAGNASGELLNWMVVAGATDGAKPAFIETTEDGNGYGAWKLT